MTPVLDREEYVEQAYFFRVLRERLLEGLPTQTVLEHLPEEILSTTRLPVAIDFLRTELKHAGILSSGFTKLPHYFTPFQAFVLASTEDERRKFSIEIGLLILEREAHYRCGTPTPAGLFVYQFETLSRNRLGYDDGLGCLRGDGFYDKDWGEFLDLVRRQIGIVDFADLVYLRSEMYVREQRRREPDYAPPVPALFGEKEGKIARANRGRDPLYLFSALQRQLGYPEVPRPKRPEEAEARIALLEQRVTQLENRLKAAETEIHNDFDLSEFQVKPEDTAGPPAGWGIHESDFE
jgi:hypothetical protein